jgi:isopentenyl diphosphate isomerase/L-lactate dehydrogenase-like FMN-dependent dehydrogenase
MLERLLTVDDFEAAARSVLPRMAYDYYRSGADDERTLRANRRAFGRYEIWYRVLVDVAERSLSTTLLGEPLSSPILIAPTAYHCMAHPEGELATARAAAAAGILYVVSTLATTRLEDVAAASSGPRWFQLYVHKDRGFTRALVERAQASGYRAVVLTVDAPLLGRRLADERNVFTLPDGLTMANLMSAEHLGSTAEERSMLARYVASRHDASLTWKDLAWIRELTPLPLLVKGIVRADDAARAVEHGAAGVVVSNHGARQLDGAPASIDALPGVVAAVGGRCPVLMDGGIRRGTDVLKALALGASAVLVGRPILWGLAVGGQQGVARVLEILHNELSMAMALAGCASLADTGGDLVRRRQR